MTLFLAVHTIFSAWADASGSCGDDVTYYYEESTYTLTISGTGAMYIYAKPKNQRERDYNDRMREKAEALRCRRFESIVNERYDFFDI